MIASQGATTTDERTTSVLVAIPTFRRLALLETLLAGIAAQRGVDASIAISVAVLDNDGSRSAEAIVERLHSDYPFPLAYVNVGEPGLASVRNRALDLGRDGHAYLAMIDDDECPEPQWIAELLATRAATSAQAVVGPVPPILPTTAPRWVRELRAREVPDYADRTLLADGWSGNCLLDVRAMAEFDLSFDRTLDFAGGEDQLFFRQLLARGGRIGYAARAVAWEDTPAKRQTFRFVFERSFRRGNTLAFCDLRIVGGARAVLTRACKGVGTIARGFIRVGSGVARRNVAEIVIGACDVVAGCGMFYGLAGRQYQAYRRPTVRVETTC